MLCFVFYISNRHYNSSITMQPKPLFPHSMTGHHPSRVWILDADVPTTPPNYSSETLRRTYTPGPVGQVYLSGIYFPTLPC